MVQLPDPILLVTVIVVIGLLPFFALVVTSYTKIVVVLGLLRQALGIQQVPPNLVLNGIAMILSVYIMAPIGLQAYHKLQEATNGAVIGKKFEDLQVIGESVAEPLKQFLDAHVNDKYRAFFLRSARDIWPEEMARSLGKKDLLVLIPGFTVTELTEAFQIGFALYLVFLIIDLVVANVLLSLGMSMVSPTIIAVPFKLLLFVMLDGWGRLVEGLVLTYRVAGGG
ncbi:MAG: type III secretion system export apparatus subunit SctR [Burkholderiaceae bacterium]